MAERRFAGHPKEFAIMPHVDGVLQGAVWTAQGQSRFARPVAAVTSFVRGALASATQTVTRARARQELEIRDREERYAHAADLTDLERMERDWDRRDGGGMRTWDWR
jgi:hypothetical protein